MSNRASMRTFSRHSSSSSRPTPDFTDDDREYMLGTIHHTSPAAVCDATDPELRRYREGVCPRYSPLWQFHLAGKVATWTLLGGLGLLLATMALAGIAFLDRKTQYPSFISGWWLLTLSSAAVVVVQGVLLVWLSFWLTYYFLGFVFLWLIQFTVLLLGAGLVTAIISIFRHPKYDNAATGISVQRQEAPGLWSRIEAIARQAGTAPPDHVIAGIDANFFVTETPLTVQGSVLTGRSLFISIPLLRILDRHEADAVLAHELGHLRGGDAASRARLLFELALRRDSREREFHADRYAAQAISASAVISALIKMAAYARYRDQVEHDLFSRNTQHGAALGIAGRIAAGLVPYAQSAPFAESMRSASTPHPFDTHRP
jgi:Zn-dependent protease with chaperone function